MAACSREYVPTNHHASELPSVFVWDDWERGAREREGGGRERKTGKNSKICTLFAIYIDRENWQGSKHAL